jgi:hypothetical protein
MALPRRAALNPRAALLRSDAKAVIAGDVALLTSDVTPVPNARAPP